MQSQGLKFPAGHPELPLAAVDDDKIRKGALCASCPGVAFDGLGGILLRIIGIWMALPGLRQQSPVAAPDHFGHAGEIILSLGGGDPVAAVAIPLGHSVSETDHGGDDVVVGDDRDVEALHGARRLGQPQGRLQFGDIALGIDAVRKGLAGEASDRLAGFLKILEKVPEGGRLLEIEFLGRFGHLLLDGGGHLAGFPLENFAGLLDALSVFLARDPGDARGGAVLDDVVEAMLEVPLGRFRGTAGAQAELLTDGLEGGAEGVGVGEWSEIARPVLAPQACQLEAGDGILQLHADEEEAFVVAEADVVLGSPLLDELPLEEHRLGVAPDLVPLVVGGAVNQRAGLDVGLGPSGRGEVVGEASPQIDRLADIDDLGEPVPDHIDTGTVRHIAQLFLQCGRVGIG